MPPYSDAPTVAENQEVTWDIDGAGKSRIEIWDTAGQETLETLRKTAYPGTEVLLIGFDTTNSVTLENVADAWITEFRGGCSDCPCIILVGTKYDFLKDEPDVHESPCSVDDDSILEVGHSTCLLVVCIDCVFLYTDCPEDWSSCSRAYLCQDW